MFQYSSCYLHKQLTTQQVSENPLQQWNLEKDGIFQNVGFLFWANKLGLWEATRLEPGGRSIWPHFLSRPVVQRVSFASLLSDWGTNLGSLFFRRAISSNREAGCKAYASFCGLKETTEMGKNRKTWEERKTLYIFAPSFPSPRLFMSISRTACCMCKTYSVAPMLAIILFLLVLPSSAIIRKQSVGSKTCC